MSRRSRRKIVAQKVSAFLNPNAAGIDIGATELYTAVPSERSDTPVRSFGTFTEDLHALAQWLKTCGIRTVAMESTGVYWIPVFQVLEDYGFEVCLVNARHVKNVPGRKTDVSDCQWLQYLHSVGLLRGSFRPPQQVCAVRSVVRHRDTLVQMASVHIQHMQKALTQMNLQLHHVISDITGVTGLAILEAILKGQRDPKQLAKLRDKRIRTSNVTLAKALVGDYRPEHLFTLEQSLRCYQNYQSLIAHCGEKIQTLLSAFDSKVDPAVQPLSPSSKTSSRNTPLELRTELYRLTGVDLTEIPGIQATTAHTLIAEIGTDLSKFPSAKHFASWLGLCPDNRVSGGKILSVKTRMVANRAAHALRLAANTLHRNESSLGDFFRRMRAKIGTPEALTATAHKLARIVYHMLRNKTPYDPTLFERHHQLNRRRMEVKLKHQAKALGFALVPA